MLHILYRIYLHKTVECFCCEIRDSGTQLVQDFIIFNVCICSFAISIKITYISYSSICYAYRLGTRGV
jgi:hypothetical protein